MKIESPVQNQRGSYDAWRTQNPVLSAGAIGIEKDTRRFKVGDGTTPWSGLKYANTPIVEMNRVPAAMDDTFEVGQVWKNTTGTKKFYVLESVAPGSAVWKQKLTADDLAGLGDMLKSIYDTNNDAKVDAADKADQLSTARNFSVSGDATATAKSFDGTQNVDLAVTLPTSGVTAGTYTKITVDAKGRATAGSQATKTDIGLGSVDNVQQASKTEFEAYKVSNASEVSRVEAIAKGASRAQAFATVAALDAWLAVAANKANLLIGDNFYIVARDVPDYWWDGTQKQELETQKIDLSEYPKTAEVQALLAAEVERLTTEINKRAMTASPTFTGTPKAPTAAKGTNTTQMATTAFVINELQDLVIDGGDLG